MNGLKGAQRIVFEELAKALSCHEKVSISILARRTLYSEQAVRNALVTLHELGLIKYQSYGKGNRAVYEILDQE